MVRVRRRDAIELARDLGSRRCDDLMLGVLAHELSAESRSSIIVGTR